jgi:hypothetical protein
MRVLNLSARALHGWWLAVAPFVALLVQCTIEGIVTACNCTGGYHVALAGFEVFQGRRRLAAPDVLQCCLLYAHVKVSQSEPVHLYSLNLLTCVQYPIAGILKAFDSGECHDALAAFGEFRLTAFSRARCVATPPSQPPPVSFGRADFMRARMFVNCFVCAVHYCRHRDGVQPRWDVP